MQGKVTERRCKLTVSTSRQPGIQAGVDAPQKVFQVDLRCQYSFPTHILSTTHTTMNHCINSKFESGPDWETVQLWPMTRPVQSNAVLLIYKVPKKGFEREHSLVFLFRVTLQCHYLVSLSGVTLWCHSPFQCPVWFLLHWLHWNCSYKYKQSRALYVDTTCFEKPHKNLSTNPIPSPDLPHFVCFHN